MKSKLNSPLGVNRSGIDNKNKANPLAKWKYWLTGVAVSIVVIGAGLTALQQDLIINTRQEASNDTKASIADDNSTQNNTATQDVTVLTGQDNSQSIDVLNQKSGGIVETTITDDGLKITKVTPRPRLDDTPVLLQTPGRTGQKKQVAHLPDKAVFEDTEYGKLPIYGVNGERAFDIYARPWSGTRGTRIAIIVGGIGLSQTGSLYALQNLASDITLAFAGNGNSLQRWMQTARRNGHEILLQIPFEPFDYPNVDPGRGTLITTAPPAENLQSMHQAMGKITNYTGVTNFMGGKFLSTPDALDPVMRDLSKRGLLFFDDGTSSQSLTQTYAQSLGIPFAAGDVVVDTKLERGEILKKLDELERIARRNGHAIGVASAFTDSVDAIAAWTNEAKARGIEFVGISALADDPERR